MVNETIMFCCHAYQYIIVFLYMQVGSTKVAEIMYAKW